MFAIPDLNEKGKGGRRRPGGTVTFGTVTIFPRYIRDI
jgi:hypothetical protein